jgi:hypothetical protein
MPCKHRGVLSAVSFVPLYKDAVIPARLKVDLSGLAQNRTTGDSGIMSAGITPWVVRCRGQPRHRGNTGLHGVHTELHGVDYLGASRQDRFRAKRHHSSSVKLRVNSVQLRVLLIAIQRPLSGGSAAEFPHGLAEGRHPHCVLCPEARRDTSCISSRVWAQAAARLNS